MRYLKEPETDPFSPTATPDDVRETVEEIVENVGANGDDAVLELTRKFDGVDRERVRLSDEERRAAIDRVPDEQKRLIDHDLERIRRFAEAQLASVEEFETVLDDGVVLGQKIVPIDRVGAYVPGGEYPLLSSALMTVTPPAVAGVDSIAVATPPQEDGVPHPAAVYGAHEAGATEIFVAGGAQAVAAMALGTDEVDPVDKLLGPGNAFVTEAKRQLFGTVGVDLLAGPSEILVIADDTADPELVAADLLAQAEHDRRARPLLVTTDESIGEAVIAEIDRQLETLATADIAGESWDRMGAVIVAEDREEAIDAADRLAAEHVEVHTGSPRDALDDLDNYGTLFLGENSANVFSDKLTGTNHTLPTGRAARYTSGLSVHAVIKTPTYQEVRDEGVDRLEPWATKQSTVERLEGHAKSSFMRGSGNALSEYDPDEIETPEE